MAKREKKATPPKPAPEWERMPLVEKLARELIAECHPELERAKLVVLGKPKAGKKGEHLVAAVARRPSKALQALWKEGTGEDLHYLIEVARDTWETLDATRRRVLIDHELCHFTGLDDKGRWGFRADHDIEEFLPIIRRYGEKAGADVQLLKSVAKQLGLFEAKK